VLFVRSVAARLGIDRFVIAGKFAWAGRSRGPPRWRCRVACKA